MKKEINKLTFNFIWEGKPAKIKKKTIISDIKRGGLKMLDFEIMNKALKIAWIKRLTEHDDAAWKIIPEFAAANYGGLSFLIECQYDVKYLALDNLPPFYHALLKYWQEHNHEKVSENSDIQNKIIWNNSRILLHLLHSYYLPYARTNYGKFNIRFQGPSVWNAIDDNIKVSSSISIFKRRLKEQYLERY